MFSGKSGETLVLEFSVFRKKWKLIQVGPWSPASLILSACLVPLSLFYLTVQSLTSCLHLALFAPSSEHTTLLHAKVFHVLIYFDDSGV